MPKITVKNYKGVEVELVQNGSSVKRTEMQMQDAIIDKVLKENDIEIPQELVNEEIAMMVIELKHKMKYESMSFGGYSEIMQDDDMDDLMEECREEAFRMVKTKLVLRGIIEAEKIEATKEELFEEAKAISIRQQMPIETVKDFFGEDFDLLKNDLLVKKAIEFVCTNAIII